MVAASWASFSCRHSIGAVRQLPATVGYWRGGFGAHFEAVKISRFSRPVYIIESWMIALRKMHPRESICSQIRVGEKEAFDSNTISHDGFCSFASEGV